MKIYVAGIHLELWYLNREKLSWVFQISEECIIESRNEKHCSRIQTLCSTTFAPQWPCVSEDG